MAAWSVHTQCPLSPRCSGAAACSSSLTRNPDTGVLAVVAPPRKFTPSVIEPSFGVGRIIYCMLEHSFYTRPSSDDRHVFRWGPLCPGTAVPQSGLAAYACTLEDEQLTLHPPPHHAIRHVRPARVGAGSGRRSRR